MRCGMPARGIPMTARGRFPDAARRYCTSSRKRGPVERELRRNLNAHPRFGGHIVNAMGLPADESPAQASRTLWQRNDRNSRTSRESFDWLPIQNLSKTDVLRVIAEAGQSLHRAYAAGMSRQSCSFSILTSRSDLRRAAEHRPALYRKCAHLELAQRSRPRAPVGDSHPCANGPDLSQCNRTRLA